MTAPVPLARSVLVYNKIQVVFDAAEPEKLAEFWGQALGYVTNSVV